MCECALTTLLNVQFNCLYERTTSETHFGKYMVNILCFCRSLSLESKPKVLLLQQSKRNLQRRVKKEHIFLQTGFILPEKILKSCMPALGFSGPMQSSESNIHSVYLSELLGIKAVTL